MNRFYGLFALVLLFCSDGWTASDARNVSMEWEITPEAKGYELQLRNKATGALQGYKLEQPIWKAEVLPGFYEIQMRSIDQRGVPGNWSKPEDFTVKLPALEIITPVDQSEIKSDEANVKIVTFSWKPLTGALSYQIEIEPAGIKKVVRKNKIDISLAVAKKYKVRVWAKGADRIIGEQPKKALEFTLLGAALDAPRILPPSNEYAPFIEWNPPIFAESYSFSLSQKNPSKEGALDEVDKQDDYKYPKLPFGAGLTGGQFLLRVIAKAKNRLSSPPASLEFELANDYHSAGGATAAQLRYSNEKVKPRYFILGSSGHTFVFSGNNKETGVQTNSVAQGYKVDLGLGSLDSNSRWGYKITGEIGSTSLDPGNSNTLSGQAQLYYRTFLGTAQWRLGLGGLYREVSFLSGNRDSTLTLTSLISAGPLFALEALYPFTKKWGLAIFAQGAVGLLGIKTPNGKSLKSATSFESGGGIYYHLTAKWTLNLLYSQRTENVSFDVVTGSTQNQSVNLGVPGQLNTSQIQQQFIGANLEIGF